MASWLSGWRSTICIASSERSDKVAGHCAAPGLGKDPRVALVGVERVGHIKCLGVGRHGAGGLDTRAPVAAADRDRPVAALVCRERVALDDRVGVGVAIVVLDPAGGEAAAAAVLPIDQLIRAMNDIILHSATARRGP